MKSWNRNPLLLQAILFFFYGAVAHILLLRAYVRHAYPQNLEPDFVKDPITHAIVALVGGVFVASLFLFLLERARSPHRVHAAWLLIRAGLYGIAATILTAAGCSLVGALLLTKHLKPNSWIGTWLLMFSSMDIGTYAIGPAIVSIPYAFLYGVIAGIYVLALRRVQIIQAEPSLGLGNGATLSLTFGILGLLFVFIPFVGVTLSALAIFYGVRTIRSGGGTPRQAFSAKTGAAIGALCIFYWVLSFAVYMAASFGWLGNG